MALSPDEKRNNAEQKKAAQERAKIQNTINKGLETSDKLTRNLTTELQKQLDVGGKINKQITDRAAVIDRMVQNEKNESSLTEKIKNTQSDISKITSTIAKTKKKNGELDRRFSPDRISELNRNKEDLETHLKVLETRQKARDGVKEQTNAVMNQLQKVTSMVAALPGGKMLLKKLGFTPENMEKMGKNLTKMFTRELPKRPSSLFKGIEGLSIKMAARLGAAAVGITLAISLFKTFKSILKSFSEVVDSVGQQFGVMGAQDLGQGFVNARPDAIALGKDVQDLVTITNTLSSEFGVSVDEALGLSQQILDSSVAMGLSADEGSRLFGTLMKMGGLTADQAEDLAESAYQLARANKVNPSAVMKDVAGATEVFAKFAKDGGKNILDAAIQARKLGVSIHETATIAESLLDFQSSLQKELSLQVLLGKEVNMQKARELAMANNLNGMMDEVLKQLGGEVEFNKMNLFQRKAMADLLNVDVATMQKLVKGQGDLNNQSKTFADIMGSDAMSNLTQILNKFKTIGAEIVKRVAPILNQMANDFLIWAESGGWEKIMAYVERVAGALKWIAENPRAVMALLGALGGGAIGGGKGALFGGILGYFGGGMGMANGGEFVTSGPTPITVGDNPGGKEHVQVTPLNKMSQMRPNVINKVDTKPMADEVSALKQEMLKLRNDMKSYFGVGGSAVRGIGSRVGDTIMNQR